MDGALSSRSIITYNRLFSDSLPTRVQLVAYLFSGGGASALADSPRRMAADGRANRLHNCGRLISRDLFVDDIYKATYGRDEGQVQRFLSSRCLGSGLGIMLIFMVSINSPKSQH